MASAISCFFLVVALSSSLLVIVSEAKVVCYREIGCFSNESPFDDLPLPQDPDEIAPVYYWFKSGEKVANHRLITSSADVNMDDLIVITHGFLGTYGKTLHFIEPIVEKLMLQQPNADVIYVVWRAGAAFGNLLPSLAIYDQPASNTRVIGRLVAQFLQKNPKFNASTTYCIGFSLGSHVCSFFSKWQTRGKLARITALDPAGVRFAKLNEPTARLDKSDADFVDCIHTSKLGLQIPVCSVDFWVNDPTQTQPGCLSRRKRSLLDDLFSPGDDPVLGKPSFGELLSCTHHRAVYLFMASILQPKPGCSYDFCPCLTKDHFLKGRCNKCDKAVAQQIGYLSVFNKNRGNFYGKTGDSAPFCLLGKQ